MADALASLPPIPSPAPPPAPLTPEKKKSGFIMSIFMSQHSLFGCVQGALSSSNTLDQLQAFAKMAHQEQVDNQDLAWQVLYLALRAGHIDVALKVGL